MIRLLLSRGAALDARDIDGYNAEALARLNRPQGAALLAAVRVAGGWGKYVLVPRKRVLAHRVLCEQGRASTDDALLRRLFPAAPPPAEGVTRTRADYRAQKGGRLPRGIFWHIFEYWRCDRDAPM